MSDCSPDSVVVADNTIASEVVGVNGSRIIQAAKNSDGGQSVDYSAWGLRDIPSRTWEWGKYVEGTQEQETYGGFVMFFDTKEPHSTGRLMAWVQKLDVSIKAQRDWKIMRAVGQFWHKNSRKTQLYDLSPMGSQDSESSEGATFNVALVGQNASETGGVEVGWAKKYGVEYTTFGGNKLRHDYRDGRGLVGYGNEGGFLKVAHCHRAQPRAWAQGLLVLLVKGAKAKFGVRMFADIKSRKGDSAC